MAQHTLSEVAKALTWAERNNIKVTPPAQQKNQRLSESNIYGRAQKRKSAFVERVNGYNLQELADPETQIDERKVPQMLADLSLLWAYGHGWIEEK
jgi:hypothetical protein